MDKKDYAQLTIIMRGYTYEEADAILQALDGLENKFAVEMTLNTPGALDHIQRLVQSYGNKVRIGAGTVCTLEEVKAAYEAGAEFLLGPKKFSKEMLDFANDKGLVTVPAAFTPSEICDMLDQGADIVKVFPAGILSPKFFKDISAPLGKLPLMAVGGVSIKNAKEFLDNGASYVGLGSGIFNPLDVKNKDVKNLRKSLEELLVAVEG